MEILENQFPIIEYFTLRGVHGYKDLSIDFTGPATVIVAENGTGKTTLLSAFNAFLGRRFHRLASISFSVLECKFRGREESIFLRQDKILTGVAEISDLLRAAARDAAVSEEEMFDFILNIYLPEAFSRYRHTRLVSQLYIKTPGGFDNAKRRLDELHYMYKQALSDQSRFALDVIKKALDDIDIVFLPTYRRVERPMLRASSKASSGRSATPTWRSDQDKRDYTYEGIVFGLGDIEARLSELSEEIERTSNIGYRRWSTHILADSLKGKSAKPINESPALPPVKDLSRFLSRLGPVENNLGEILKTLKIFMIPMLFIQMNLNFCAIS